MIGLDEIAERTHRRYMRLDTYVSAGFDRGRSILIEASWQALVDSLVYGLLPPDKKP